MVIDRLPALREAVNVANPTLVDQLPGVSGILMDEREENFDVEAQLGISREGDEEEFMAEYLYQISTIKDGINNIVKCTENLAVLGQQLRQSTEATSDKDVSTVTNKILDDANRHVMLVKNLLEAIKKDNDLFSQQHPAKSEARIRENLHAAVTRRFRDVIIEYQTAQGVYKQEVKNKVARQVRLVHPEVTTDELQEITEGGNMAAAATLIRSRVTGGSQSLHNALADIHEKYRDVMKLENSVAELHQMFVDLAALVDAQGELLDQIQHSVQGAKDYTDKAERDLVKARRYQLSSNKRTCWCLTALIVLIILIGGPALIFLFK
ncbi:MAG: hypothetical protein KVP17_002095 [Porospora cf. gigantea B]|uniref:uncharacterized protein n=1 Tax=Porospora cf. gigantea B TaxID=2853592 RepID=UPI003571F82E|nr:MAG: hypothetical protein KVP17_002095 [Porospora cf. gigantea B]